PSVRPNLFLKHALVKTVLQNTYQPLLSENALLILYRLRRNLLVEERGRGEDTHQLEIEMPSETHLEGAKLAQISLEGAWLPSAHLEGADLRQCLATGANLTDSCLKGAVVSKADLHAACLLNVDASNAVMCEVNLQGADLAYCNFTRADLSGAMLTARNIDLAVFREAILRSATLPADSELATSASGRVLHPHSPQWNEEQSLLEVRRIAARVAKGSGAWFDAEDIASDVVLYLLSRPGQVGRIRKMEPKALHKFIGALAVRFLASPNRESERYEVPMEYLRRHPTFGADPENAPDSDLVSEDELLDAILNSSNPEEFLGTTDVDVGIDEGWLIPYLKEVLTESALRMLIHRYITGKSTKEIAQAEGMTEMQVARQLSKARELARHGLRSRLQRTPQDPD
ncbi:MAG TPA: pentapeptide repeat-containing protein, partial [Candidatus Angelobacter sp.]